jgi:hypothetical protein
MACILLQASLLDAMLVARRNGLRYIAGPWLTWHHMVLVAGPLGTMP